MKIRFLEDRKVLDAVGTEFKKNSVVDVSEASANHWITRGVAEPYVEPVKGKGSEKAPANDKGGEKLPAEGK